MKNKDYWKNFYKDAESKSLTKPSAFSDFVLQQLSLLEWDNERTLIDIGCGNGKDLFYMRSKNINAYGVDMNLELDSEFIQRNDALKLNENHDAYYMRFFLHTLEEEKLDTLMTNIHECMGNDSHIFIETRSVKGVTDKEREETFFKSSIGEAHFRMLYSLNYLENKFKDKFTILFSDESDEFAPFKSEKPYVIRLVMKKKLDQ